MSCMLKGPDTSNDIAIARQMVWILINVSVLRSWGGVTKVASPEWTPAFSTCSDTAMHSNSPSCATASTSISCSITKIIYVADGDSKSSATPWITYFCFQNKFGDDNRMFLGNGTCFAQVSFQILIGMCYAHSSPTQNVRRSDQTRIAHIVTKFNSWFQVRQFLPPNRIT